MDGPEIAKAREVVERLREEALCLHGAAWRSRSGGQDATISGSLADKAADMIEALLDALPSPSPKD